VRRFAGEEMYTYEPITKDGHIRILQLHSGNAKDRIQGSLVQLSLNKQVEYEAISYCWGDPKIVQSILCDGHELGVTENGHAVLRSLRDETSARNLWIDAICINQRDNTEKEQQISVMAQIYAQAKRVIIWLGDDSNGIERLDRFVDKALQLLPEATLDSQLWDDRTHDIVSFAVEREEQGELSWRHIDWTRFHNLLSRPWFERKWVIQEAAWAKEAVVICGDVELPWGKLADLAFRACLFPVLGTNYTPQVAPEVQEKRKVNAANVMNILMMKMHLGKATVLDCVLASTYFKCTVPHDHVFALLPLSHGRWSLKPNYSITMEEVFTDFAISSIVNDKSLNVFSIASGNGLTVNSAARRLPSWVPDLTSPLLGGPLTNHSVFPRRFFAGGDRLPEVRIISKRQVECRGFIIDTVRRMATTFVAMLESDLPPLTGDPFEGVTEVQSRRHLRFSRWIQAVQKIAGIDIETASVADRRALCKTLMCDLTGMRHRVSDNILDAFCSFLRHPLSVVARTVFETEDDDHYSKYTRHIEQSLAIAGYRRFCSTEAGRMGMVPSRAEDGDQICIFLGAEVPYVLRPTGCGTYTLIGDCYLNGIMDGEALSMGGRNELEIVLE
jgi:Heterokaryon incompatibility protein (HET)